MKDNDDFVYKICHEAKTRKEAWNLYNKYFNYYSKDGTCSLPFQIEIELETAILVAYQKLKD